MTGDLVNSRTARSLVKAMAYFRPKELRLMAPDSRELPASILGDIDVGIVRNLSCLDLEELDVLYMAGFPQAEGDQHFPESVRSRFRLTAEKVGRLGAGSIILNPLPRIDEIESPVDLAPQAAYFEQSQGGLPLRMAVLEQVIAGNLI